MIILGLILTIFVPAPVWDRVLVRLDPFLQSFGVVVALAVGLALVVRGSKRGSS